MYAMNHIQGYLQRDAQVHHIEVKEAPKNKLPPGYVPFNEVKKY